MAMKALWNEIFLKTYETLGFYREVPNESCVMDNLCVDQQWHTHENPTKSYFQRTWKLHDTIFMAFSSPHENEFRWIFIDISDCWSVPAWIVRDATFIGYLPMKRFIGFEETEFLRASMAISGRRRHHAEFNTPV